MPAPEWNDQFRELDAKHHTLEERYDALRNRRVVRWGLALASLSSRLRSVFTRSSTGQAAINENGVQEAVPSPTSPPTEVSLPQVIPPMSSRFDLIEAATLDLLDQAPGVTVVVPVYNASEELADCVASLRKHVSVPILYIDDGSTDPGVASLLDRESARSDVEVLANPGNLGFTATVNRGIDHVEGDVLLLNSDTVVPPRLVEHLRLAAYLDPTIASVTALSDNAGAFSAPNIGENHLPQGLTPDDAGRAVAQASAHRYPTTPTANGFCVYLKRRAIDDVGGFDADKYPRGYGEENDWSMRASARGWRHTVDDSSYVHHVRSASFGDEKSDLSAAGFQALDQDHPGYQKLATEFVKSREMESVRSEVGEALVGETPRPRVLYVLHAFMGGAPETTRDLISGIADSYEAYTLVCDGNTLRLTDSAGEVVARHKLRTPVTLETTSSPEYRAAVASLLVSMEIEVVHIRHLLGHTLDLPSVCRSLGTPVAFSVHDFYLLCPTAHLMDNDGNFCGGTCTPGQGTCHASPWVSEGPHLKHGWVDVWKTRVEEVAADIDLMVATTESTRRRHTEILPGLAARPWEIVEHGRELQRTPSMAVFPPTDEPIRLLMAGTIGLHKGNDLVRAILDADIEERIEVHVLGTFPGPEHGRVTVHGLYEREEFPQLVAGLAPAAMLIASVTAETYSHTLTEAQALGLPTFVTDRGAPMERLDGGGWVIPADDPAGSLEVILGAMSDREAYAEAVEATTRFEWPTREHMAEDYREIYDGLRHNQGGSFSSSSRPVPQPEP